MFDHGIVAGKFWPLHNGHDLLIRSALAECRRVTILLVHHANQEPDGDVRTKWLREAYPTARVVKTCDLVTDDTTVQSNVDWAEYTKELLGHDMPDAVFSSEDYALGWAKALGATHVMVDKARSFYAISGTEIRNDPYAHFHLIHPVAKPYYVKRVLLVGAESTGKTTLCKHLATKYSTVFVPEYGRMYVERHGINDSVKRNIFPAIVNKQPAMEDELIKQANRVLFCDTDLWTTSLWYEKWQPDNVNDVLGETIREEATMRDFYDLVFVMDPHGTEWEDDGLRDQKDSREWFTDNLLDIHPDAVVLSGDWEQRENDAIEEINKLLRPTKAVLPRPEVW